MKQYAVALMFAVALCACTSKRDSGQSVRMPPEPVVTVTTSVSAEGPPTADAPNLSTSGTIAGYAFAGRLVANALLLKPWRPGHVRLTDPQYTFPNSYDGPNFPVNFQEFTGTDGVWMPVVGWMVSFGSPPAKEVALYEAAIYASDAAVEMAMVPEAVREAYVTENVGNAAYEIAANVCMEWADPSGKKGFEGTPCIDRKTKDFSDVMPAAAIKEFRRRDARAKACAMAIVRENESAIRTLAHWIGCDIKRESLLFQSPEGPGFVFLRAFSLDVTRSAKWMKPGFVRLPARAKYGDLPSYCVR